jgi:hypothetical protein
LETLTVDLDLDLVLQTGLGYDGQLGFAFFGEVDRELQFAVV